PPRATLFPYTTLFRSAENKVTSRPIKTGSSHDNSWIVESGLKAGDRVIVEGLQKVQPGAVVTPVPWKDPAAGNAPTGNAPAAAADRKSTRLNSSHVKN